MFNKELLMQESYQENQIKILKKAKNELPILNPIRLLLDSKFLWRDNELYPNTIERPTKYLHSVLPELSENLDLSIKVSEFEWYVNFIFLKYLHGSDILYFIEDNNLDPYYICAFLDDKIPIWGGNFIFQWFKNYAWDNYIRDDYKKILNYRRYYRSLQWGDSYLEKKPILELNNILYEIHSRKDFETSYAFLDYYLKIWQRNAKIVKDTYWQDLLDSILELRTTDIKQLIQRNIELNFYTFFRINEIYQTNKKTNIELFDFYVQLFLQFYKLVVWEVWNQSEAHNMLVLNYMLDESFFSGIIDTEKNNLKFLEGIYKIKKEIYQTLVCSDKLEEWFQKKFRNF